MTLSADSSGPCRPPGPDETGKELIDMHTLPGRLTRHRGDVPELTEWIALRRVRRGGVAKVADCYLDHGRPMPSYLTGPLDDLTGAGLLALSEADPAIGGLRRIAVTDTGHAQYVALCRVHNRQGVLR